MVEGSRARRELLERRWRRVARAHQGHKEPVDPSAEILDATYRLGQVFRRHGRHWKTAKYAIDLKQDGSWKYTVDFSY